MKKSKTIEYLEAFINSGYTDYKLFQKACDKNINLEIYLCIKDTDLKRILDEYKSQGIVDAKELSSKLVNNQPIMNSTLEIYEKATLLIQKNMDNYIKYHGFKMANSAGTAEDWYTEFLIKYWYNVNFYKIRWFFPEQLKKQSKVVFKPMLYKDFLYQSKAIISNEKRLRAHQAAINKGDSLFKSSLDKEFKDSNKKPQDILSMSDDNADLLKSEIMLVKNQILTAAYNRFCVNKNSKYYNDNLYTKIEYMLLNDDIKPSTIEGKCILLLAFKVGLEDIDLYKFINKQSIKTKSEWGISQALINHKIEVSSKYKSSKECYKKYLLHQLEQYTLEELDSSIKNYDKNKKAK